MILTTRVAACRLRDAARECAVAHVQLLESWATRIEQAHLVCVRRVLQALVVFYAEARAPAKRTLVAAGGTTAARRAIGPLAIGGACGGVELRRAQLGPSGNSLLRRLALVGPGGIETGRTDHLALSADGGELIVHDCVYDRELDVGHCWLWRVAVTTGRVLGRTEWQSCADPLEARLTAFLNDRQKRPEAGSRSISTVAGTRVHGDSGDGGPSGAAALASPSSLVMHGTRLFVSCFASVHVVELATGAIDTFAGTGVPGFSGDDGPARLAQLTRPHGVACADTGHVYIADPGDQRVRYVDAGGTIRTLAGTGSLGDFGDDGFPAAEAQLHHPLGLVLSPCGTLLYVAEGRGVAVIEL